MDFVCMWNYMFVFVFVCLSMFRGTNLKDQKIWWQIVKNFKICGCYDEL